MPTPLDKKSSTEEIRRRFDRDVERFSNLETGQQATLDGPLVLDLLTQSALQSTPQVRTVLDIGCGAGNYTLKLLHAKNPLNCTLVDLSAPMLERARARIKAVNSGEVQTLQGDFRTLDLPVGHYDVIFAAAVLHHLREDKDWELSFQKLFQITRPGGSIWISDLVWHENQSLQNLMWDRYGLYLEGLGGQAYRQKVFEYIDREDSPRPVTYQMDLLRKVGFSQVDILHKNSCFAAFGACKPAP